jgi:hypothetical protein
MSKRFFSTLAMIAAAIALTSSPVNAQAKVCKPIRGTMSESFLPVELYPNDPFGRGLGLFHGDFAGFSVAAVTALLITPPAFSPGPPAPTQVMQVRHGFNTGPGDVISTLGKTIFNVAPGTLPGQTENSPSRCPGTPCIIQNPQVLDIQGGTGRWAGATGQLRNLGLANLNLPQGQGQFVYVVEGEVCLPASSVSALSAPKAKE